MPFTRGGARDHVKEKLKCLALYSVRVPVIAQTHGERLVASWLIFNNGFGQILSRGKVGRGPLNTKHLVLHKSVSTNQAILIYRKTDTENLNSQAQELLVDRKYKPESF